MTKVASLRTNRKDKEFFATAERDNTLPKKKLTHKQATLTKCDICQYKAKSRSLLQYHVLQFHNAYRNIKWLKCKKCVYKSLLKHNFLVHLKTHRNGNWLLCENCPFRAKQKCLLKSHMRRHVTKYKIRCSFCTYSSNFQSSVSRHERIHKECKKDVLFQCIDCSYQTRIKSHFERHYNSHTKFRSREKTPWLTCQKCPFRCLHNSSLQRHMSCHERKIGYKCDYCSYRSPVKSGLSVHLRCHKDYYLTPSSASISKAGKKYKCLICLYTTSKKCHFTRHEDTHKCENKTLFKCNDCPFECSQKFSLKRHIKCHKTRKEEGEFRCSYCSFTSQKLTTITTHAIKVHNKNFGLAKLFSCHYCLYTTIKQSDLNRHELKHKSPEDIDWFCCKECPFKAKRKYQLGDHVRRHSVKDGVKCFHCSYRSASKRGSLQHLKLHSK